MHLYTAHLLYWTLTRSGIPQRGKVVLSDSTPLSLLRSFNRSGVESWRAALMLLMVLVVGVMMFVLSKFCQTMFVKRNE